MVTFRKFSGRWLTYLRTLGSLGVRPRVDL
jgi:hypothetical protein